jgi:serine/threonine protein phosphatase 1
MSTTAETKCGRLLCIGDVHGCAAELETLLVALDPRPEDRVVFLGDYVDRGPDSRRCIELLIELATRLPQLVLLRGNHEETLIHYLAGETGSADTLVSMGGGPTLASYGLECRARTVPPSEVARERVPESHRRFLDQALRLQFCADGFCFVHAGVRPRVPLEAQTAEDLLWIREPFLGSDHGLPYTVVFGHTPYREVHFDVPRKIGLDTGCVFGGRLSCLDLTQGLLLQVPRGASAATTRDVRRQLAGQRA